MIKYSSVQEHVTN